MQKLEDINLEAALITIRSETFSRCRQIPIGVDLGEVLRKYLNWRSRRDFQNHTLRGMLHDCGILRLKHKK
jgi:hypothetical protein